jgi:hypothetical protein
VNSICTCINATKSQTESSDEHHIFKTDYHVQLNTKFWSH